METVKLLCDTGLSQVFLYESDTGSLIVKKVFARNYKLKIDVL